MRSRRRDLPPRHLRPLRPPRRTNRATAHTGICRQPCRCGAAHRLALRRRPTREHLHLEALPHRPKPALRDRRRHHHPDPRRPGRPRCEPGRRAPPGHSGQHPSPPDRDPHLACFPRWIEAKLAPLPTQIAYPVREFATWHHLRRIRGLAEKGSVRGSVQSAKQEITQTIKFLTWLDQTHSRTAATCTQQDVDAYLAYGPTTRTLIRTFFVTARKTHLNKAVTIGFRQARRNPSITQEQRLQWIRELLTGTSESLPYRVAGILLLLLAQPLVKVAALRIDDLAPTPGRLTIRLGRDPLALPEPFADLVRLHVKNRPNTATTNSNSPWLFPSNRAGQHLHPNTIMLRVRQLGIDLRAARNRALADLVTTIPPSLVADALGYSYQTVFNYAANAGEHWARYAGQR